MTPSLATSVSPGSAETAAGGSASSERRDNQLLQQGYQVSCPVSLPCTRGCRVVVNMIVTVVESLRAKPPALILRKHARMLPIVVEFS